MTVTVSLENDTGISNSDSITYDLTLTGEVESDRDIAQLTAKFQGQEIPADVTDALAADGSFVLDLDLLETVLGGSLEDGEQTIILQAVSTEGVASAPVEIEATLDATPPEVIFGLAPSDDTPPVGDDATEISPVILSGQTEPHSKVVLLETGEELLADATGKFQFSGVELVLGENNFNLEVTDIAGNQSTTTQTIVRTEPEEVDTTPPVIAAELANDTGASDSDRITYDATITGAVSDESSISKLVARFGNRSLHEITDALTQDNSVVLNLERLEEIYGETLPDGVHVLSLQATDSNGNLSEIYELTFTLDRTAPTVIFGLDPDFDTPPVGDEETTISPVNLAGQTEAGAAVVLAETGATVTADDAGKFDFSQVELELGSNSFSVEATDIAGNVGSGQQAIIRNEPEPTDTTPPAISLELAIDTGISESDSITNSAPITGNIADESSISQVVAAFNDSTDWLDVTSYLEPDNSFDYTEAILAEIFGGSSLPDGSHILKLRATDEYGNLSEIAEFSFVLDTVLEGSFGLDPAFDTEPVGDGQTELETVTLAGETEAIATIVLQDSSTTASDSGAFQFSGIGLELGENEFEIVISDAAGNELTINEVFNRLEIFSDTEPPVINLGLQQDTGISDSDSITNNPAIVGRVSDNSGGFRLEAKLNNQSFNIHVSPGLGADGSFVIDENFLESLLGGSLVDGEYELSVLAEDEAGNASSQTFQFVLDSTPPEIDFGLAPDSDTEPLGDGETLLPTVALTGQTEAGSTVTLLQTGAISGVSVRADEFGAFVFPGINLELGENDFKVDVTDIAGNRDSLEKTVTRIEAPVSDDIVLREEDNFSTTYSQAIEIPDAPSVLSFTIAELSFDETDPAAINDAFEFALLDADRNPLVHTISSGRDAFFNLTEGVSPLLAAGATFSESTVRINLSQLTPGTEATLAMRLVNDDSDTETFVRIRDIVLEPIDPATRAPVAIPELKAEIETGAIAFQKLSDVTAGIAASYRETSFNEKSDILYADLGVSNTGLYPINGPVLVAVENISDPTVRVIGADGTTPELTPYYDLTQLLSSGESLSLEFYNPDSVQFDYELRFLGQLNQAPEFVSEPDLEAVAGKAYIYEARATDADGDSLTYSLVSGPAGLSVDAQTGRVVWNPAAEDIGNHAVTLRVEDAKGGVAEQEYILAAINPPPNRPPVIVSAPVVDANVNVGYRYQVEATDADSDSLSYALVAGPEGMAINTTTGELTWTPTGEQLGGEFVSVSVADGKGGTAEQSFEMLVGGEPGNRAPIIVSEPLTEFGILPSGSGQTTTVNVVVRDFSDSHANFQGNGPWRWHRGIVNDQLGADRKPTLNNGYGYITPSQFSEWYRDVPGVNLTTTVPLALTETSPGSGLFRYYDSSYFPIDNQLLGNEGRVHNYHFTTEIHARFTYQGGEVFRFTGDDDVWVFINNQLAVDLGGLHTPISGRVNLDTLGLTVGETYPIDIFHAERQTYGSNFQIQTTLEIESNRQYAYRINAVDAEDENLTFSLVSGPDGMKIDPVEGLITWNPTLNQTGRHSVEVQAVDGRGGIANQSFEIDVTVSSPSEIRGTVFKDVDGDGVKEGFDLDPPLEPGLQGWVVYIDENRNGRRDLGETFSTTDSQGNYVFSTLPSGLYTLGIESQAGRDELTKTKAVILGSGQVLTDADFGVVETSEDAENRAPILTSTPPSRVQAQELLRYETLADDPDGDSLVYDLPLRPDGMVIDSSSGVVLWQPTASQQGLHDVITRVRDDRGGVKLQSFEIEVFSDRQPTFSAPDISPPDAAVVFRPYQYRFRAQDADEETLSFRLDTPLEEMTLDSDTGILNWTPTESQLGQQSVTITVIDSTGAETSQNFDFSVVASTVNADPTITSTPRETIGLGSNYLYQLQATDPNGDPLTYILETAPAGMTLDQLGRISWQPAAAQFGSNPVSLRVEDGQGGIARQNFAPHVTATSANQAPSIDSVPSDSAIAFEQYIYNAAGSDPDSDPLWWSLDAAPEGMSIDPERGTIRWTPTQEQIGSHEIAVRLTDALGTFVGQSFTLSVRGVNVPPVITSAPPTVAAADKSYNYLVQAVDAENQPLNFSVPSAPEGMVIEEATGLISWTPSQSQIGEHNIEVVVEDSDFAATTQSYKIVVSATAPNSAPVITSSPVAFANLGQTYQYPVAAYDPDGEAVQFQLLEKPDDNITIDQQTGLLSWTPTVEGVYTVAVGATDSQGLGAAQRFAIDVAAPVPPLVSGQPITEISPGETYRYNVNASHPSGERLSFSLDTAPTGMTVDEFGRIVWNPTNEQLGIHPVSLSIVDPRGNSTVESYELTVVGDEIAPEISLFVSQDTLDLGESVTIVVNATDNVGVESLSLTIDGENVALDPNGRATLPMNDLGEKEVVARATDAAGNIETATRVLKVLDFSDVQAPVVELSSLLGEEIITGPVEIVGTVNDSNLREYVLEAAPAYGGEFVEIFRGNQPVTDGVLGTFDPSLLENDSYILRLTATDKGGNSSSVEEIVDVSGELKLGNFRLSFTDLEIPVSGIPISVTRTYDTLTAGHQDDFGYGWRLEFRDTDLRTSLPAPSEEQKLLGIQNPFADGTRVYVTLPGGKRTGFTFRPRGDRLNSFLGSFGGGAARWFHPAFVADDGSDVTLSVPDVRLIKGANTDEYYDLSGTPYNPENPRFGSRYTLTTKEGIVYEIDAVSGDLVAATDRNGNKLTFSDAGILSDTGVSVTFERDGQGRIAAILDPEGNKIRYQYDSKGDLVAVTDREDNTTEFKYEVPERAHYLNSIIDPLGRTGVRSEYDESGRLSRMLDVNGEAVQLSYDPGNSTQTVYDQFGNPTTYVYDDRGNVVSELDPVGLVTNRTYDENNNVLTEAIVTDESGLDGWTATYTYDADGNKLSAIDPLGHVSRWTYNRFGQVLTETDALGNTTNYTYSPSGNLLSNQDAEGNVTKYSYDLRGNLLSATDANNETTQFRYDQSGNVLAVVDPLGNETTYTYNSRGDRLTETRKVTTPNGVEEITTKSEYDSEGRLKSATDAENQTTEYRYDANDRQIAVIDALGRRTETRYDSKGQLIETIYPDGTPDNPNDNPRTISVYDLGGRQRATVDEAGRVVHYKYDASGRQTETIYPDGIDTFEQFVQAVAPGETAETVDWTGVVYPDSAPAFLADNPRTITEYSKNGRTKADIDERGDRTEYRYNAPGQLLETIYPDRTPGNIADNPRATSQYDASGRQIASINALNRTTEFVYDELGRVAETHFADGTTTKTIYDAVGRRIASIDQAGNKTEYEYDALGRLTDVVQFLDPGGENKEIRTEYGYDELGRLIWQEDANDNRTNYEYDLLSRRTAVILPEGQRSETTYDAVGNVNTQKDFNGEITVYRYDEQNRQVLIDLPDDPDITFTYTPTGQRETVTDGRGTTSYVYDERDRLTSRTDPTGPYISSGATIEYEYDAAGNRTLLRTPGGFTSYQFDEQNRLETVTDSSQGVTTYKYDAVSNLVETVLPNGVVETRQYDQLNRLEYLENELGGTVISSYDYELDPVGNRLSVTEHDGRKVEYEYDSLYRLVSENISDPSSPDRIIAYTYDNVGNRLSRNDSVEGQTNYQYNDNDWLLEERYGNGDVVAYQYDNNGNTIKRVKNGTEETVYVWDDQNRLVEVRTPDGDVITYTYDVDNIRVSETVNGVTTQYIVDKNRDYAQVIEEYVDGELQVRYVYGFDLISQERDGQVSVYLADGLGSTRVLTDAGGQVQNTYTYDAFGNLISNSGSVENKYQFAGEQLDENLGQYYLRQRYYDAGIGRFTRRDTYEGEIFEPVTLHKYLYANANPAKYVDPSGNLSALRISAAITVLGILSSIVIPNPFELPGGIDVFSDSLFPDPTNGLGGHIDFDPIYDFVFEDIAFRFFNRIPKNRNVAVFEYIDRTGKRRLRAATNVTRADSGIDIHAEKVIASEIQRLRIPARNVTRIYSEFQPCNRGSNNCTAFLKQNFPQAKVYWSFSYNQGMNDFSRISKYSYLEAYGISFD